MNLKQLHYFVTLAQERHFGRAAERLNIVQPALSMQIKALEDAVGGALFERRRGQVELTEAGRLMLIEARHTLSQAQHTYQVAKDSLAGNLGRLRIGFVGNAVISGLLLRDLERFHQAAPEVDLQLRELPPQRQIEQLSNGEIDLAYGPGLEDGAEPRLNSRPLGRWPVSVAMHPEHPLAQEESIPPQALAGSNLILLEAAREEVLQLWPLPLIRDQVRIMQASSSLAVMAMVAAKIGVALTPSSFSKLLTPAIVHRPLQGSPELMSLAIVTRKDEQLGAVRRWLALVDSAEQS